MATKLPRLNVTVTQEQHALLLELAKLNGGSGAGYLRQMLDQATPLLRQVVPMLRAVAEETELTKQRAAEILAPVLKELRDSPLIDQPGLFESAGRPVLGATTPSGSEGGRSKHRRSSRA